MEIFIECPHCKLWMEIVQINCGIFRHAIYKNNYQQINPHASKELCNQVLSNNLVYGCAKPFRIEKINNQYIAVICEYI